MPEPFRFDRHFDLDADRPAVWRALERPDRYPTWWSWLRSLEGGDLREGAVARCVVRAPLPYTLRFDVVVDRVVREELVETHVRGDLEGPARLELAPRDGGCTARLVWTLDLRDTFLRPLSIVTRPAMAWAHDRVVALGLRQFERAALDRPGRE